MPMKEGTNPTHVLDPRDEAPGLFDTPESTDHLFAPIMYNDFAFSLAYIN
jgi:hypothetical protein